MAIDAGSSIPRELRMPGTEDEFEGKKSMLVCRRCETKNKDSAVYCKNCGKSLEDERKTAEQQKRIAEDERRAEEKRRRAAEEEKRAAEEARRAEEEKKRFEEAARQSAEREKRELRDRLLEKEFSRAEYERILTGKEKRDIWVYRVENGGSHNRVQSSLFEFRQISQIVGVMVIGMMVLATFLPFFRVSGFLSYITGMIDDVDSANFYQVLAMIPEIDSDFDQAAWLLVIAAVAVLACCIFFAGKLIYEMFVVKVDEEHYIKTMESGCVYTLCASLFALISIAIFNGILQNELEDYISEGYWVLKIGAGVYVLIVGTIIASVISYMIKNNKLSIGMSGRSSFIVDNYDPTLPVRPYNIKLEKKNDKLMIDMEIVKAIDRPVNSIAVDLWMEYSNGEKETLNNIRFTTEGQLQQYIANNDNRFESEVDFRSTGFFGQISKVKCFTKEYEGVSGNVKGSGCYCIGNPREDEFFKALVSRQFDQNPESVSVEDMTNAIDQTEEEAVRLRRQLLRIIQNNSSSQLIILPDEDSLSHAQSPEIGPGRPIMIKQDDSTQKKEYETTDISNERKGTLREREEVFDVEILEEEPDLGWLDEEEPDSTEEGKTGIELEVNEYNEFCPYCGNRVHGMRFCGKCGKRVNP